jgi:hypothetical protein
MFEAKTAWNVQLGANLSRVTSQLYRCGAGLTHLQPVGLNCAMPIGLERHGQPSFTRAGHRDFECSAGCSYFFQLEKGSMVPEFHERNFPLVH